MARVVVTRMLVQEYLYVGELWVCVNSAGVGSYGGQAPSHRSPFFSSDLPDIRTSFLICLIFLPRVFSSLLPSLLPLSPGVQLTPQWPSVSLPCQAILLTQCQHHQRSWDAAKGNAARFNQPMLCIYLSPISPGPAFNLPCSIKIPCYLLNSHLLISSALAASISNLSV